MPQKITLILRPESGFDIPYSDGYQLYSSLLGVMREADETAASHTHDSPISSISLGPLEGKFLHSHRSKHKVVDPNERYSLNIGITDPKEVEIFRSIIQPLVLRERNLRLERGDLRAEEVSSSTASFQDIVKSAGEVKNSYLDFEFKSPVCIQYRNSKVIEMFPQGSGISLSLVKVEHSLSRGAEDEY